MNHQQQVLRRRTGTPAFTLIELLVVVAIIGVLASILIPVTGSVRMTAQKASCASNMRQIGIALRSFANDNRGQLPKIAHSRPPEESWIFTLAEYLDDTHAIRVSPADPQAANKRIHPAATTYVMNDLVFFQETDPFTGAPVGPQRTLFGLNNPSQTILAFTGAVRDDPNQTSFSATNDHTHAGRWTNWSRVTADISPDLHRSGGQSADQTNGSSNYLFADGRVESFDAADVKRWIQAGINIANPEGFRPN